jgi:hypothetical protein
LVAAVTVTSPFAKAALSEGCAVNPTTVSAALLLVVVPAGLVNATAMVLWLQAEGKALSVIDAVLAPATVAPAHVPVVNAPLVALAPFKRHWYVAAASLVVTVNVALWPCSAVAPAGWVLIAGVEGPSDDPLPQADKTNTMPKTKQGWAARRGGDAGFVVRLIVKLNG